MGVKPLTKAEMKLLNEILGDFNPHTDEEEKLANSIWDKLKYFPVRG